MEKGYYWKRILRSLVSVFFVIMIVFVMVYSLVPRDRIFSNDSNLVKLGGKPDEKLQYQMRTWQKLGYLTYADMTTYCGSQYEVASDEIKACLVSGSSEESDFVAYYESKGYTVQYMPVSQSPIASKDIPLLERMGKWFSNLISFDNTNSVQDTNNPDLERGISVGSTPTGGFAIKCSGCTNKYLFYTDSKFPFIHQNWISMNLGTSYPTYDGLQVLDVIGQTQGKEKLSEMTFETGKVTKSAISLTSCTYKSTLDRLDKDKFTDNYANCSTVKQDPSMISTSLIMGVIALILSYGIGLPVGIKMAKSKDKFSDKLGMAYIIFIISVPSLAYIFIFRYIGANLFGLPTSFATKGAQEFTSWILPTVSLALPSIASLMLWMRRYMVDQMNSDYVKFAKAKGLSQSEIFNKHIFRNAVIPIAQGIPTNLAACITGAIITESVYAVPGMGKMLPDAIKSYNNSMVIALAFIFTFISVFAVFLGDVIITKIDPRITLSNKEGRV